MAAHDIKVSSILFFCLWLLCVVILMVQMAAGAPAIINGKRGRWRRMCLLSLGMLLEAAPLASASILLARSQLTDSTDCKEGWKIPITFWGFGGGYMTR